MKPLMKMNLLFALVCFGFCVVLNSNTVFAHGEDKPGPNGGFIQMPGAYHTEVVPFEKNKFKVYLLDINWKNPVVKDSSVESRLVTAVDKKAAEFSKCSSSGDHFLCELSPTVDLKSEKTSGATLELKSTRDKATGIVAKYSLPLKLKHSGHHH